MQRRPGARGALALIVLLLALLGAWWLVGMPQESSLNGPLIVLHTASGGAQRYSGTLMASACDNIQTGISASGTDPARVRLSFILTSLPACISSASDPAPFAVSYASAASQSAVLDSVTINNTAAAFSVIENQ